MDRAEQLAALSGPAADQWGLITTAQAKQLGLNPVQLLRLTEAGLLNNVSRGVYALEASGTPRHADIKAAWLRLQPGVFAWDRPAGHPDSGVISHASACQLHELGDIPAPDVEITVPRRRTTTEPFVRLRTATLDPTEITIVEGLPVTAATRTITDLLKAKADGGHIGGVIAEAQRRDLIDLDDLAQRVQPYARKYGLKATTTGQDLISHLVEQAGESLTRQEVARASKEGFDAAVHLLAENPDLAPYLAHHLHAEQAEAVASRLLSARQYRLPNYSNVAEFTGLSKAILEMNERLLADSGLSKTLQEMNRKLSRPSPALTEALRKLTQPSPALTESLRKLTQPDLAISKAMRDALTLPPVTRAALQRAAGATADQPVPLPASQDSREDDNPDDRSPDGPESV